MADRQESGADITIPSVFISHENGEAIKRALKLATPLSPPKVRATWRVAPQGDGSHTTWTVWTEHFTPDMFVVAPGVVDSGHCTAVNMSMAYVGIRDAILSTAFAPR